MWAIDNIISRLKIVSPPKPKPKPPLPPPLTTENAAAKVADRKNSGLALRGKIECLANQTLPSVARQPSAAEISRLAQDNAPILVLPKSNSGFERFFEGLIRPNVSQSNLPADPLEYIANSTLNENVPAPVKLSKPDWNPFNGLGNPLPISIHTDSLTGNDKKIGDNTDGDTGNDFGPEKLAGYTDEKTFLDLNNDKRGTLGSTDAPVHYQFEPAKNGEPPKLTYHFFYDYNDAPKGQQIPIDFNHEGDWERVTYELNPQTLCPVKAELSAHEGGTTVEMKDLQKDSATGRPLIFVANGSHANYATPGNHPITALGGALQLSYDQTSGTNDAVLFDTSRNLREVTSQSWYPISGGGLRWGEIGESEHSSGPQGPSENKGAV